MVNKQTKKHIFSHISGTDWHKDPAGAQSEPAALQFRRSSNWPSKWPWLGKQDPVLKVKVTSDFRRLYLRNPRFLSDVSSEEFEYLCIIRPHVHVAFFPPSLFNCSQWGESVWRSRQAEKKPLRPFPVENLSTFQKGAVDVASNDTVDQSGLLTMAIKSVEGKLVLAVSVSPELCDLCSHQC